MLPPDTLSNLLPWRVMVPLMQMLGCFPYRMSVTDSPPSFSLPLCLWAVFFELYRFPMFYLAYKRTSDSYLTAELGTTAFIYCYGFMFATSMILPVFMGLRSPKLAALLHDLSGVQDVSPSPTHHWYCKPKSLALLLFITFATTMITGYVTITYKTLTFFDVSSMLINSFSYEVCLSLPTLLCFMVFGLLARRLLAATEATVARVSMSLAHDGTVKCKSGMREAMLALRDLDVVVREVEVMRERGIRFFFPMVTLYLLVAVLLSIVCPYAILNGNVMSGMTVMVLLIDYCMMFSFFQIGQAFINKVSVAEELLKDLRVKSQNFPLTAKVNQVMGSLSPMLTFSMCGWYNLDYASFLVLVNTVLTYVVIIFQVGGNTFQSLLSPSVQQINSSALQ